jgi:hypothetical membrane protein
VPRRGARCGPVLWLLTVQYFVVQVVVAGASSDPYSWSENTISDLGNTACGRYGGRPVCSPLHLLMDASFVMLGLTMSAGAVLIRRQLTAGIPIRGRIGAGRTATVGFAFVGLAGAGTVVVGLFPENTISGLHVAGAALPFVFGNTGVLVLGVVLRDLPAGLRGSTLAAGAVGLVGLPLFLSHAYLGLGSGGMERITAYPQDVWLIVIGAYLLLRPGPAAIAGRRVVGQPRLDRGRRG